MVSRSMRRATRSARAVLHGPRILDLVTELKNRRKLIAAAESGVPPVTAISTQLNELIGPKDAKLPPVKQFAGLCISAVLEEEGFAVASKGVRLSNDPIFRTGSTYERLIPVASTGPTLLARFVQTLNEEEIEELIRLVHARKKNNC